MLFENFLYHTLRSLRNDPKYKYRQIVLLMDNAVIHKHQQVLETAMKMKAQVLFNAEYSPWLNPVENFFGYLKKKVRADERNTQSK